VSGDLIFSKTQKKIEDHIEETKSPSISVAVARDGKIIWEESFGWADVEKKIEATPNTMYHLGSLGKVYTATGIMILKERGFIDLDKPANQYLGDTKLRAFEGNTTDVTVRRILNHTSGLPYFWTHLYEEELENRPPMAEIIGQYGIIVSPPGERFIYSNLGFGILGYIIEQTSGKPYNEFMETNIFEPLGLSRTQINTGPYDEDYIAQKYTPEGKVPYSDHISKGGGTVYASAHDLVRFGMFHLKNHLKDQENILSDKSIDDMQNAPESFTSKSSYRIGWQKINKFGYRIFRHGGHVLGALSSLRFIPSENIAVAVISNGENANTPMICDWIFAELLFRYNTLLRLKNTFSRVKAGNPEKFKLPPSLAGIWRGNIITYEEELPVQLSIESDGNVRMIYMNKEGTESKDTLNITGTNVRFSNNIFTTGFRMEIPTSFTKRYRHAIRMELVFRGETLSGYLSAEAWEPQKPHFNVPSYVRLEKIKK